MAVTEAAGDISASLRLSTSFGVRRDALRGSMDGVAYKHGVLA